MPDAPIESVSVAAYRIPTEEPESDGTLAWDATTMVVVEIAAGGVTGLGYTYGDRAVATLVAGTLAGVLEGRDAFAIRECWHAMVAACRNQGRTGLTAMAVAACDVALHDLAATRLGAPVAVLLGGRRTDLPVYGSGGFTSLSDEGLARQLGDWAAAGLPAVKMKVGREPARDPARVAVARCAVGETVGLFVDANGAYARRQALDLAVAFRDQGVTWFEEPVSSDDLDGLRLLRDRAPAGLEITAGEYGYHAGYFRAMAASGAVDVLQADATRCGGFTGYMLADAVAHAFELPLSSHTAPALHRHCGCASLQTRHLEWFADHVRIERMLFDGAPEPDGGRIGPDPSRPGLGLAFRRADAEPFRL